MALNFDKYAQEGNTFMKNLATRLGHPEEISRTGIILRSVLHTLRDRLTISESLNLLSQLPAFIKVAYIENWKYQEKPTDIETVEQFTEEVKKHQDTYGETEFNWSKSTQEIVEIVLNELGTYVSEGEAKDVVAQLPERLKKLFSKNLV